MIHENPRTLVRALPALGAIALLLAATPAAASDPCISCMQKIFDKMQEALRKQQEPAFAKQWHPLGYQTNLVGGSGLPGRRVYRQGSRKQWFLRPDFKKLRSAGRGDTPWIVPCKVWSWKKQRAVDKVWAVLVYHHKRFVMLGGGERLEQVTALARRWHEKKPLEAPKK